MMQLAKLKNDYENILLQETDLTDDERKQYREIKKQIIDEMSQQKGSEIVKMFSQVIDNNNQLEIIPIFTLIIKGYLQAKRDPI